jgi:sigma-B regulation protein RsbU (phosphoserine phosphatase)
MPAPRILIVDDEPLNIDYLQQELDSPEFVTLTASNGQEALDRVARESPDLILLDIMMPVMDGFEVLRRLKADAATRSLPVIIISAASDISSVVKGIQLGAEDYLPKPFEPTLLRARITSGLEKKRLHDLEQVYLKGLERELDIAREIQQGFLPAELPNVPGWELAAYFRAAREVAGDFYDAFLVPDGRLVCLVGDVCGKGVGAALFMTLFRSLLRAPFTAAGAGQPQATPGSSPSELLQQVVSFTSNYVADTHAEANMFATVFMGIFDPSDGTLTYVNCGNEAALLLSGNSMTKLGPTGPVIGIIPGADFGVKQVLLQKGDLLVAFTDGITDATNAADESFGQQRLAAAIREGAPSPDATIAILERQLAGFVGSAPQFDDITLLAVRRSP